MLRSRVGISSVVIGMCVLGFGPVHASGLQDWIQSFAESQFKFTRSSSNVPMVPMAWANIGTYGKTDFSSRQGEAVDVEYEQETMTEAALMPFLAGSKDAIVIGEMVSIARFDTDSAALGRFSAVSVSLPMSWMRQSSASWQLAAFIAPMGHKASLPGSSWSWEYMGGVFGRHAVRDDLSWVFGFFADLAPGDDLYIPYVGAQWAISPRWTLSAIMPWPAVIYAPSKDTFVRVGASPSGSAWAIGRGGRELFFNADGWNLGVGVERRVWRSVWLRAEAGISGLRGLNVSSDGWNGVTSGGGTPHFLSVGVNFRPSIAGSP